MCLIFRSNLRFFGIDLMDNFWNNRCFRMIFKRFFCSNSMIRAMSTWIRSLQWVIHRSKNVTIRFFFQTAYFCNNWNTKTYSMLWQVLHIPGGSYAEKYLKHYSSFCRWIFPGNYVLFLFTGCCKHITWTTLVFGNVINKQN